MIEINAKTPSKLADDVESWLRTLPSFDAGEAIERVGSEVADLIPGRRRSRLAGLAGWEKVLPSGGVLDMTSL